MNAIWTAVIVVIVVLVVLAAGAAVLAARRRARLRERFGPEYDRTVRDRGSRRDAERELMSREERVQHMDIRPLDPAARENYRQQWSAVQEHFVDTPEDALSDADRLVRQVMTERGYEAKGYEERVATLSVGHGRTLEHYRAAHDISTRASHKEASTEELRQAMVHYRALFEELLGQTDEGRPPTETARTTETRAGTDRTDQAAATATEQRAAARQPAVDPDAGGAPWTEPARRRETAEPRDGEGPR